MPALRQGTGFELSSVEAVGCEEWGRVELRRCEDGRKVDRMSGVSAHRLIASYLVQDIRCLRFRYIYLSDTYHSTNFE